ncbi:MAG: hypothetical protein K0Q55_2067 [Verrucomicrobia bacterium]|jgi:hypothetical protein|nr:hypothetical protein [Verrucomicrobiota bacterium]
MPPDVPFPLRLTDPDPYARYTHISYETGLSFPSPPVSEERVRERRLFLSDFIPLTSPVP